MTVIETGHCDPMPRPVIDGVTHGIKTSYTTHGCRCEPCTTAQTRYTKAWRYHQSQGRAPLMLDSQPVRDHVQALRDAGMAFSAITAAAGYASRNSLISALSRDKVQRVTYRRIMAVTLDSDPRGTRYVPLLGSQRRLQALMAIGHTSRSLSAHLGLRDHSTVLDITAGKLGSVRASTADSIRAMFDALWDKPGGSYRTAAIARRKGWAPPLAWEDDAIDNPDAVPDGVRKAAGKVRSRAEVLEDWLDTYWEHQGDVRAAASRLGLSYMALSQTLQRAKRDGVETREFRNTYKGGS